MRSTSTVSVICLAVLHPLAVSAQRGGNRGGGNWQPPAQGDWVPPAVVETVTLPTTTQPPITIVNQGNGAGTGQTATANQATTTTSGATTGGGTTGGGTTGGGTTGGGTTSGECGGAIQGNMNVKVSGSSVSYRFEPPVAGNPSTGTIGDCDTWSFPVGWNGRVHVGGGSGAPDGGTLFEGNNVDGVKGAMDVSYVEGFSVPMMCIDSSNGFKSGCAIDLFTLNTCPTGGSAGGVCKNPQGPGGTRDSKDNWCEACSPPDKFFKPCAAAAYTFPTDDDAVDGQSGMDITCTVGASSDTTNREGNTAETGNPSEDGYCTVCPGSVKRSLEDVLFGRRVVSPMARSPSMLPRAHKKSIDGLMEKRSSHRHRVAHGSDIR
ncbi:MAG: hypothetical protein L6R40_001356 [Gallowayella cf. fulva]|nr:MAG: hypothetical protein L6R40_001356 [Xanthomendoza cf. fulva]